MTLVDALSAAHDDVLEKASDSLERAHLKHYEASDPKTSRRRLSDLLDLVLECLAKRTLDLITQYANNIAEERFGAGSAHR